MPHRTIQAKAPLFMRHEGVKVYHVYRHDDAYTFDPVNGSDDRTDGAVTFDVRDLSTFDKGGPQDEAAIKKAIRAALDKGEIGPAKGDGR